MLQQRNRQKTGAWSTISTVKNRKRDYLINNLCQRDEKLIFAFHSQLLICFCVSHKMCRKSYSYYHNYVLIWLFKTQLDNGSKTWEQLFAIPLLCYDLIFHVVRRLSKEILWQNVSCSRLRFLRICYFSTFSTWTVKQSKLKSSARFESHTVLSYSWTTVVFGSSAVHQVNNIDII